MGKRIGERIKVVLKNRGMSYSECGKRVGMSKQGVGYWLGVSDEKWDGKARLWWGSKLGIKWLIEGVGKDEDDKEE